MIFINFSIVFFILIISYSYLQCWKVLKKSKLPSLPFLPLIGHCHYFFGKTDVFYKKLAGILNEKHGFGLFIGPFFTPIVFDVRFVSHLINLDKNMLRKSSLYKVFRTLVDRTIFLDAGTSYTESKRVLLKGMGHTNLQQYVNIFNKNAKQLANKLKTSIDKEFNLEPDLVFCAVSIILEATIGLEAVSKNQTEIERIGDELSKILRYTLYRGYSIWLFPDFLFRMSRLYRKAHISRSYLRKTCEKLILERRNIYQDKTTTPVLIDTYFTTKRLDGKDFSIETIIDDVITLLGAGIETTVSSIGFIIMLLAMNQDVQKRVIEEIDSKIPECRDEVNSKDLDDLPYLDQVIHESWRLFPPVPAIGRTVTKEVDLPNGGRIAEGSNLWFSITKLHRDKEIFPNPNEFNPDNFLPEKNERRPKGSYIPFGFGSRKCIGNVFAKSVIRAIMCHLLKTYTFHTTKTIRDFRLVFEVTLKNKIGVPVTLKCRNKT